MYGVEDPGAGFEIVALTSGLCCRLPREDILTSERKYTHWECPEDHVLTYAGPSLEKSVLAVTCTKINTERYQLGEPTFGRYLGFGFTRLGEAKSVSKHEIPAAIRHGLERTHFQTWDIDGCVGYPWGSLLVAVNGRHCYQTRFRQLQYKGKDGDPPRGTAVTMFPACDQISDVFAPVPHCINHSPLP